MGRVILGGGGDRSGCRVGERRRTFVLVGSSWSSDVWITMSLMVEMVDRERVE